MTETQSAAAQMKAATVEFMVVAVIMGLDTVIMIGTAMAAVMEDMEAVEEAIMDPVVIPEEIMLDPAVILAEAIMAPEVVAIMEVRREEIRTRIQPAEVIVIMIDTLQVTDKADIHKIIVIVSLLPHLARIMTLIIGIQQLVDIMMRIGGTIATTTVMGTKDMINTIIIDILAIPTIKVGHMEAVAAIINMDTVNQLGILAVWHTDLEQVNRHIFIFI